MITRPEAARLGGRARARVGLRPPRPARAGTGAGARGGGHSGVQTHMTNTLNIPNGALETRYPLRVTRYALRRGSGGAGLRSSGDGLIVSTSS
jgi:N-methylhydantoinase B/oxoprolinase/acetone carboxylase alpha subunit